MHPTLTRSRLMTIFPWDFLHSFCTLFHRNQNTCRKHVFVSEIEGRACCHDCRQGRGHRRPWAGQVRQAMKGRLGSGSRPGGSRRSIASDSDAMLRRVRPQGRRALLGRRRPQPPCFCPNAEVRIGLPKADMARPPCQHDVPESVLTGFCCLGLGPPQGATNPARRRASSRVAKFLIFSDFDWARSVGSAAEKSKSCSRA